VGIRSKEEQLAYNTKYLLHPQTPSPSLSHTGYNRAVWPVGPTRRRGVLSSLSDQTRTVERVDNLYAVPEVEDFSSGVVTGPAVLVGIA
jgi:hypothetical protein